MKDKYVLRGHSNYSSIKELHKISEESGIGVYEPYSRWKDNPEEESSYRIGYDPKSLEITMIDLEGGPYISKGFELEPGVKVMGFTHNNFKDVRVILENEISD